MDQQSEDETKLPSNARTTWAELHVADFLSVPLIREFVFRSLQAVSGGSQKEVVDFLVTCDLAQHPNRLEIDRHIALDNRWA